MRHARKILLEGLRKAMSEKLERYRKAYFALWKELPGTEHVDRHDFNESVTGKRSTKDFTMGDWDAVVAELQRRNGQHDDRHAHVRSPKPGGVAEEGGRWCTWHQAGTIEDLADQVDWGQTRYEDALDYALRYQLGGKQLRRRRVAARAREVDEAGGDRREAWRALTRQEASALIQALEEMRRYYRDREPRSASHNDDHNKGRGQ